MWQFLRVFGSDRQGGGLGRVWKCSFRRPVSSLSSKMARQENPFDMQIKLLMIGDSGE